METNGGYMTGGRRFLGTDTSEPELLAGVAKGELDALGEIYRRHGAAVLAAARQVVADPTAAEAVTAEVFIALWDAPGAVGPAAGLRAYLVSQALALIGAEEHDASG
jgi:DNA-directed RNA polymerase specialized sigma24 family protein